MPTPQFIEVQDEDGSKVTVNLADVKQLMPDEDNPKHTLVVMREGGVWTIPKPHAEVQRLIGAQRLH